MRKPQIYVKRKIHFFCILIAAHIFYYKSSRKHTCTIIAWLIFAIYKAHNIVGQFMQHCTIIEILIEVKKSTARSVQM